MVMVFKGLTNLASSVRVPQNVVLGKVSVRREDDHIEDHGDSAEERLKSARVRGLKEVQEKPDHLEHALSGVTPTSLQPDLLELVIKLRVRSLRRESGQIVLGLPQNMLEGIQVLNSVIQHHRLQNIPLNTKP